jgi:arginine decarboxylase
LGKLAFNELSEGSIRLKSSSLAILLDGVLVKDHHLSILPTNTSGRSEDATDASTSAGTKTPVTDELFVGQSETDDSPTTTSTKSWSIEQARELYGVRGWGEQYFDINNDGNVAFTAPTESGLKSVSLMDVIDGLHQRDLRMPVMLRIENLIEDRVRQLNSSFRSAMHNARYQGDFRAVFPIKVNQQHHVVDSIGRSGRSYGHGMEAGSKAELLVAMVSVPSLESLIVCNGYKDEEFIDLGLQACRLG